MCGRRRAVQQSIYMSYPAGRSAANPQQRRANDGQTDGMTDRRAPDRYIDPATMRPVTKTTRVR